jgi:hypothetical protein
MASRVPSILDYEFAVARRIAAALGSLAASVQEQIALVALTVSNADADPRSPVITVAAGTSIAAPGPWDPRQLPYPDLETLGDPNSDPELANLWRTKSKHYDAGLIDWDIAAAALGDWRADRKSSPVVARQMAISALVRTAGKLRTRLRQRVHLNDQIVLLAFTDRLAEDQCALVTEQMNPFRLPLGAAAFLNGDQPPIGGDYTRAELIEYARAVVAAIVSESIDALDGAHRLMFLGESGPLAEQDQPFVDRYWELAHAALNFKHGTMTPPASDWQQHISREIIQHSRTALDSWH